MWFFWLDNYFCLLGSDQASDLPLDIFLLSNNIGALRLSDESFDNLDSCSKLSKDRKSEISVRFGVDKKVFLGWGNISMICFFSISNSSSVFDSILMIWSVKSNPEVVVNNHRFGGKL